MSDEQLQYLYGLGRYGIKPGLVVMEQLMEALGHPERQFKSVHITGTNGKGSTASLLESALRQAGIVTGLYTSPHLYRFNERIRVSGMDIPDAELLNYIDQVRSVVEDGDITPTFFEFTTAVAFLYFAQRQVELAVLEVGMGGLGDATNIIPPPLVAVITHIDLDHLDIIGPTKENVAQEKAGIIKTGTQVVTAEQDPAILTYLQEVCQAKEVPLFRADTFVRVQPTSSTVHEQSFRATVGDSEVSSEYTISLVGKQQLANAAIVLTTISLLREVGYVLPEIDIAAGLARDSWEGRLEVISTQPYVLVDGAHNAGSLAALYEFITDSATKMPSYDVLVVAMKQGKDQLLLFEKIAPLFKQVIVTEGVYLPEPAQELAQKLRQYNRHVVIEPDAVKATERGLASIGTKGAMLITGSLYMIPVALAHLKNKGPIGPLIP